MADKILFVDDEPNVLAGFARQLRGRYAVETAHGPAEGGRALAARGPFAVVVSDMRMPEMDGARFLARVRAEHPDAVRLLLTGYADLPSAIQAVNDGWIFRFLTKPCPPDALAAALDAALAQHRLVAAERELLEKTLRGSVQVLGELLALTNPPAFERALRIQRLVRALAADVPGAGAWEVDVAAILSQLGYAAVPEHLFEAIEKGHALSAEQEALLDRAPQAAVELLRPIPRLERVTEIVVHQHRRFDAPVPPTGKDIPLGARLLKAACDFDALTLRGVPRRQALDQLRSRPGWYDPDVLAGFGAALARAAEPAARTLPVSAVACGMLVADDVYNDAGACLLRRGTQVTQPLKLRLQSLAAEGRVPPTLRVLVPPPA